MAHAQLGNAAEGKNVVSTRPVGVLRVSDPNCAELQLMRAEAAGLLGIADEPEQPLEAIPSPAAKEAADVENEAAEPSTAEKQKGDDAADGDGPAS